MAKHSGRGSSGEDREPDFRVRPGGGAKRQRSARSQLARLVAGRARGGGTKRTSGGKRHGGSKGRGTMPYGATNAKSQRVVVKALSRRHYQGRAGGLKKHVSYLGRDGAGAGGERGVFYTAEQDVVDAREMTKAWQDDKHHFRVIVSPENAHDIADLRAYVRDVMHRVGQDLGVPIEWLAVNHHNTDNPHAHVLIRGADRRGDELFIRREYIGHGFRERAAEAATELLGERTEKELRRTREREVSADRFTSLDRMIERGVEKGSFDTSKRIGFHPDHRRLVAARLQHLERLGLATKDSGARWRIEPEFKRTLMRIGMRQDIIRQLYSSLGTRAGHVSTEPIHEPVAGVVVAKGAVDEIGAERFVVIRDVSGGMRYAKVPESATFARLKIGDRAELGRGAHNRREAARQVLQWIGQGGRYSNQEHERNLLLTSGDRVETALAWMRAVRRQVEAWANWPDSGVQRTHEIGVYRIDRATFERYTQWQAERSITDVRNLTAIRERERERERSRDLGRG